MGGQVGQKMAQKIGYPLWMAPKRTGPNMGTGWKFL